MRKIIFAICALMLSVSTAEARPHGFHHGGHAPTYHYPHKHHHHGDVVAGIITGIVGASILNHAIQPKTSVTTIYEPVLYTPAVVATPVVAAPAVPTTVVSTTTVSQPCYTTTNFITGAATTHCNSTIVTNSPTTYLYSAN